MQLGDYGYEKTELLKIAEKIYGLKGERQQAELQLASEEFHEKYIPKREKTNRSRFFANLPIFFVLTAIILLCILLWIDYMMTSADSSNKSSLGVAVLSMTLFSAICVVILRNLITEEYEIALRFIYSRNPDKALRFAKKHDINTFQDDRLRTEGKIALLKERIYRLNEDIKDLEKKQQDIIDEKLKKEEILKKHNIIREDINDSEKKQSVSSLSLKQESVDAADVHELYEYFTKEQDYIMFGMRDLEFKLAAADKEIYTIDENMRITKQRIIIAAVVFCLAVFVQSFLSGVVSAVYGTMCLIAGLTAVFALERTCRGPIIRYYIEKESPLLAEYCFKNDIVPVKQKKQEIEMLIEQQQASLDYIKTKKLELDSRMEAVEYKYDNN